MTAYFRRLARKLRSRLANQHAEQELSREVASHLALLADDFERRGMTPEQAQLAARRAFGGVEQAKQAHRDERSPLWIEQAIQDLRYGVRTLSKRPAFALTAVLTLALGIGACTAIFSLVNAVLLRSLPYGDPERLVYLFSPNSALKIPVEVVCPSYGDFYDLKRQARSFANMSNFEQAQFSLMQQGTTRRIGGARVDSDFFSTLETIPELGRTFTGEDNLPAHAKVAVISHSLWLSLFAASPDVLHRSIQLNGSNYQIAGVMPARFEYPLKSDLPYGDSHIDSTQIWVPLGLSAQARSSRAMESNVSVARLRPGVSIAEAQSEMAGILARLNKAYPSDPRDADNGLPREWGAYVERFLDLSIGPVRSLMRLLLAAVGLVLLIACGNVANLLLARAVERTQELGVRAALGAGRGRMVRQLLIESMLIGAGGCAVGLALARLFLRLLPKLDPGNIPRLDQASLDTRVLLFAIGASLLTSLLAGLLPAIGASRMELTEFLKSHAVRGNSAGRLQNALIVAQTAMVVVLLAGSGLLIRSYLNVESVDTGFNRSAMTFHVALDDRYSKPEQRVVFYKDLLAKLEALPGVQAAGSVNYLPLTNSESIGFIWIDGFANKANQQTEGRDVTPHYFAAMSIPLLAGRYFTDADVSVTANQPVIINQKFADTFFPGRNPIGGRITGDPKHPSWSTVVGVVADVRHTSLEEEPQPQMYNATFDADNIAVRSTLPPATVANEIRATLRSIDPNLAASDMHSTGDLVSIATAQRRFQTSLMTVFAVTALVMALVGLSGLMRFSVTRRTREVGIRMALGADRRNVLLLVLRKAFALVAGGLGLGLAGAWFATRLLGSFLFGVSQHDPFTMLTVSMLLLLCGMVAAFLPARRAASIDPMQALRTE